MQTTTVSPSFQGSGLEEPTKSAAGAGTDAAPGDVTTLKDTADMMDATVSVLLAACHQSPNVCYFKVNICMQQNNTVKPL